MTITKTAFLIGGATGAIRAGNLSDEEATALKEHYGVSKDTSLQLNNAVRGGLSDLVGSTAGFTAGGVLGSVPGLIARNPFLAFVGAAGGAGLGALAGTGIGSYYGTEKYSRGNAQKIIREKQQPTTKTAFLVGTPVGAIRASNLSAQDKDTLKEHYNLDDDASLGWRNAGRGAVGEMAGTFLGSRLGRLAGRATGASALTTSLLDVLGGLGGGVYGLKKMTDKYSVGNAEKLKKQLAQQDTN